MGEAKTNGNALTGVANEGTWPGIDSRFRLIIVAGLRTKQLLHGSKPRIEVDKGRRRNTSIALEEVKRGLVPFTKFNKDEAPGDNGLAAGPNRGGKDNDGREVRARIAGL
jgi:DNA-directed RNA polymerase omega subunit